MIARHDGHKFQLPRTPSERPSQLPNHAIRLLLSPSLPFRFAHVMQESSRLQHIACFRAYRRRRLAPEEPSSRKALIQLKRE